METVDILAQIIQELREDLKAGQELQHKMSGEWVKNTEEICALRKRVKELEGQRLRDIYINPNWSKPSDRKRLQQALSGVDELKKLLAQTKEELSQTRASLVKAVAENAQLLQAGYARK